MSPKHLRLYSTHISGSLLFLIYIPERHRVYVGLATEDNPIAGYNGLVARAYSHGQALAGGKDAGMYLYECLRTDHTTHELKVLAVFGKADDGVYELAENLFICVMGLLPSKFLFDITSTIRLPIIRHRPFAIGMNFHPGLSSTVHS